MKNNKRGLSEVVTAVLLVLLAIAAVVIVWAVVKGFLNKATGTGQENCLTVDLAVTSTNITKSFAGTGITVTRNPGAGIVTGVSLKVIDSGGEGKSCVISNSALNELDTKTFDISALSCLPSLATGETYKTIEAYSWVTGTVGGTSTLCPTPATYNIPQ